MNRANTPELPGPQHGTEAAIEQFDLRQFLDVIRRRKLLFAQVFLLVLVAGVTATLTAQPVYRTTAKLALMSPARSTFSMIDTTNPISTMLLPVQPESAQTQLEELASPAFQRRALERAKIVPNPRIIPPRARVELPTDNAALISIIVEGGHPEQIARFASTMIEMHSEETKSRQGRGLDKTLAFVRDEHAKAQKRLKDAQQELMSFRRRHPVHRLNVTQELDVRKTVELDLRVQEAEANLGSTQAQLVRVREEVNAAPLDIELERRRNNPQKAALLERLNTLKIEKLVLLQEYRPNHPRVQDMEALIASCEQEWENEPVSLVEAVWSPNPRRELLERRLTELEGNELRYQEQVAALRRQLSGRQQAISNEVPWEVELEALTAERDRVQSRYAMLSERLSDLEIRDKMDVPMMRTIQAADVPISPFKPRKTVSIMLSLIVALGLALGAVFLQELLDDRVRSPEDVERLSRSAPLPALGFVPLMNQEDARRFKDLPANSHVAEAYRGLRSSIGFAGLDAPLKRLQLTSASKGEGKTLTCVNLATAMALDGKRVILVDCDLRRPNLHRVLGLPNTPGLTEVLAGVRTVDEVLQETGVENLKVICSGPMIVLHTGATRKGALRHMIDRLEHARARIVGVVYNQVQANKSGYYYYTYYHYYGDGYYADSANRGDKARRNGRKRRPALKDGEGTLARTRDEQDDA
jgi:polysaccharide biosynthesis transport protein